MRLCFASNNAHKLDEIRPLLPAGLTLLSLADIGCQKNCPKPRTPWKATPARRPSMCASTTAWPASPTIPAWK